MLSTDRINMVACW